MPPRRHQPADGDETIEVETLSRQQRVPLEVRDHALEDVLEATRLPLEGLVTAVRSDASAPEVRLDRMKHLGAISVLADGQRRPHLPSQEQLRSRRDRNGEAAFAVDVSGDVRREELATVSRAGV